MFLCTLRGGLRAETGTTEEGCFINGGGEGEVHRVGAHRQAAGRRIACVRSRRCVADRKYAQRLAADVEDHRAAGRAGNVDRQRLREGIAIYLGLRKTGS